jgi:hypothetical protein
MAGRYIEMKPEENWTDLSGLFSSWLAANVALDAFGWSEGDSITLKNGTVMLCFNIPDRHGDKIRLFEQWAATTGRIFGLAQGSSVHFPNVPGLVHELPIRLPTPTPSWLR